jgi:predicted nucleotidyltransferase
MNSLTVPAPTPDPALNEVLSELVTGARSILSDNFIAAYLQGSFALGDWDVHSDVDFVIAIDQDVSGTELAALQSLHARLYDLEPHWAQHLEGSYIPVEILQREDPSRRPLWFLDHGSRELALSDHDNTLVVRWVTREYGVTLAGLAPDMLIDPVDPDALRREVLADMRDWARQIFADPEQMNNRWYQPFPVLSYCRMLYTLATGRVTSKPKAATWAQSTLNRHWSGFVQRAWAERPNPSLKVRQPADPGDLQETLRFIQYALDRGKQYGIH